VHYRSLSLLLALVSLPALAWGQDSTTRAKALNMPPPLIQYPPLLREAGIEGLVRFRVLLDSVGRPELNTFQVVATANPGFDFAILKALDGWRDSTMAGRLFEHTVLFILLDGGGKSGARCRSDERRWVACARL
jgi:hypothetical protein